MEPSWSLVLAALSLVVTVYLSIRSWYYGGSVIKVEVDLLERRWLGADITGSVARWRRGIGWNSSRRDGLRLHIVKLTVRNKGRTAATIMDPGLRFGRPPVPHGTWTVMPPRLLPEGETNSVVRIDSHDAKVFYFYLAPAIRGARDELGDITLAFRGAITTGTGKTRLSPRWRGKPPTWNVPVFERSVDWIGTEPLSVADRLWLWSELTAAVYEPPMTIAPQMVREAAKHAEAGADTATIHSELEKLHRVFPDASGFKARDGWLYALATEAHSLGKKYDSAPKEAERRE